jgi:hypothetical protein
MTQCGEGRSAQGTWGEPVGCLPYPSVALTSAVALRRSPRAQDHRPHTPQNGEHQNATTSAVTPAARPSTTSKISLQTPTTARPSVVKPASANVARAAGNVRRACWRHSTRCSTTGLMSSLLAGLRDAQLLQQVIPVAVQPRRGRLATGRVVPLRVVAGPVDVARHGGPRSGHNGCPTPLGGPRTTCAATGRPPRAGPWRRGRCGQACRVSERCTRC